mmetsp:Transcript_31927/g.74747  ORF Transcript_31927/g.74747 Transcript_31927/m.74747 type:complete len:584 (+) Transcript_31927:90-1841(+)
MFGQQRVFAGVARASKCGRQIGASGCLASRRVDLRHLGSYRAPVQAKLQDGHRQRHPEEAANWMPALASGVVGFTGLVLLFQDSVAAKSPEMRQEVYVWGRREAIPGGANGDVLRPTKIEWFDEHPYGWEKIVLGPSFGAALDKKGRIFVWGEGRPMEAEDSVFIGPAEVSFQGGCNGQRVQDMQCSSTALYILTKGGRTYMVAGVPDLMTSVAEAASENGSASSSSSGKLEMPSTEVPGIPRPGWFGGGGVKQMAIGLEHAAFLTKDGEVYCVGGNSWGQCGVKPTKQKGPMGALEDREHMEVTVPTKVQFPEGAMQITRIAVGGRHTVCQDASGNLYSFGDDRRIQLGLGDTRSLGNDERHSYGVLHVGDLPAKPKRSMARSAAYRYYQPHMQWTPTQVQAPLAYNRPAYPPASFLVCGEDFTVAVHRDSPDWYEKDQETNVVFCCGENGEGQCGRSYQQQQQVWLQARLPKRSRTTSVACGQGHCLALLASGQLFGWGTNMQGQLGSGSRAPACPPVPIYLKEPPPPPQPAESLPVQQPEPRTEDPGPEPWPEYNVLSFSCGFRNTAVICEVPEVAAESL